MVRLRCSVLKPHGRRKGLGFGVFVDGLGFKV